MREGMCVNTELIHFVIQQKVTSHCKAVIHTPPPPRPPANPIFPPKHIPKLKFLVSP